MPQPKPKTKRPDTPLAATPEVRTMAKDNTRVKNPASIIKMTEKNKYPKTNYRNLSLARSIANEEARRYSDVPATASDSADYRTGYKMGLEGKRVSDMQNKYEGKNQYIEKGRWDGQNVKADADRKRLKQKLADRKKKK
jgi:hypothetical protein